MQTQPQSTKSFKERSISLAKKPVNILFTKVRNLGRRYFSSKKPIQFSNHNLRYGPFEFIQKKTFISNTYALHGVLYNAGEQTVPMTCDLTLTFLNKKGHKIQEDAKLVGILDQTENGYVKSVATDGSFTQFFLYYTCPPKTTHVKISISSPNSSTQDLFLVAPTLLETIRLGNTHMAYILNQALERFYGKFEGSPTDATLFLDEMAPLFPKEREFLNEVIFHQIKQKIPYAARYFGELITDQKMTKSNFADVMYYLYNRSGSMIEKRKLVERMIDKKYMPTDFRLEKSKEEELLLHEGFPIQNQPQKLAYTPDRSVLYLLHNSLPYNSGGYAARSHGLIKGIATYSDFEIRGMTRTGYPSDRQMHISKKLPKIIPTSSSFEKIEYVTTDQKTSKETTALIPYVQKFTNEIVEYAQTYKPFMIHAASFFHNGLAAIQAARKLGIKCAYEVRGLQEITKLSKEFYWNHTDHYKFYEKLEAQALQEADLSITITKALRDLMISRGVTKEIHVVPNAVDTDRFKPLEKNFDLQKKLHIQPDETVIGYVGSILEYEGLDDLLVACRNLKSKNIRYKLLILGDGPYFQTLQKLAKRYNLQKEVIFTGRVPHGEVHGYMSLIDIMPFPRKPYLVCEMVSPLKPFESLATQKAVIVSSCSALEEIIQHNVTGLVFKKADIDDLTQKLIDLIHNKQLRETLAEAGHHWVQQNRSWKAVSKIVTDVYSQFYDEIRSTVSKF